jgi:hypothetical protein
MRTATLPIARLRRGVRAATEEESDTVVASAATRTSPVEVRASAPDDGRQTLT